MASFPYFVLTDGTTTITFADGAGNAGNYALDRQGWVPSVAARRTDGFSALGDWEDVAETIPIIITGSSVANMYANVHALAQLLDKADQFWEGIITTPVVVRWVPQGSANTTSQYYEALVLGRAANDETNKPVQLSNRWLEAGNTGFAFGLTLAFWRRGLWLLAAESGVASGSVNPGAVWSATFASTHPVPSPIDLRWQIPTLSATRGYFMGTQMLAVVGSASDITVLEAESGAYGPNAATSAIANARGGNVARYTPGALESDITYTSGLPTAAGRYAIYASMSTNSPTDGQFSTQTVLAMYGTSGIVTPLLAVPTLHSAGQTSDALFLGIVDIPIASGVYLVQIQMFSTATGVYYLDIDYLVFVRITPTTTILTINDNQGRGQTFSFRDFGASATQRQNLQHLSTSNLYPISYLETNTGSVQGILEGVNGSLVIPVTGTNVSGIWMATNHANGSTAEFNGGYRIADSANAVYASTYTATRRRGFLVPE